MMTLTWYLLGVAGAWCVWFLCSSWKTRRLGRLQLAGLALGMSLMLFCVAWCVGSLLEGVPRAASMGLVFFGLPGVILATLSARRLFTGGQGAGGGEAS